MTVEVITHDKVSWVNIEKPSSADIEYLGENYNFHPLDLEDCLSPNERPKIDEYEDYLFIVMHFPVYNRDQQVSQPSEVDFFIGARYLITVHDGSLKPLARLFDECQKNGARPGCSTPSWTAWRTTSCLSSTK
jgi:magnesium transporter